MGENHKNVLIRIQDLDSRKRLQTFFIVQCEFLSRAIERNVSLAGTPMVG